MIYLSFDDTDSREGMCTTYLTLEIIRHVEEETGYLPAGYPLLVRLNPNIPWKTRGNGAVSLAFTPPLDDGEGPGRHFIGESLGGETRRTWYGYEDRDDGISRLDDLDGVIGTMTRILQDVIAQNSRLSDENTDPGFAIFREPSPGKYYENALHRLVELESVEGGLKEDEKEGRVREGYVLGGFKKRRGIIGAVAASGWDWQGSAHSFELLAYRTEEFLGTERNMEKELVRELETRFPSTFNSYDSRNDHCAILPNSPCPVLYGIRGTDPGELYQASLFLDRGLEEPVHSKLIFRTNQGTDAHIREARIGDVHPYGSFRVRGYVAAPVTGIRGGHLFFDIEDDDQSLKCAAFEPTKEFRKLIRELEPGDLVECWGGVHEPPFTLNIEKIAILELVEKKGKLASRM